MRIFSAEDIDRFSTSLADRCTRRGDARRLHRAASAIITRSSAPARSRRSSFSMPAWTESAPGPALSRGAKIVNVFPAIRPAASRPSSAPTCCNRADRRDAGGVDGTRLTTGAPPPPLRLRRGISRDGRERLLVVGAGALAPYLARAHASQRSYKAIAVWNRRTRARPPRRAVAGGGTARDLPAKTSKTRSPRPT